jgi:hypothetical protein
MMTKKNFDRNSLHKQWVHSHEEDTESGMVFRPASFPFPPSRGRTAFTLKPDGSLVEIGIGSTDRRQESQGTWKLEDDNSLSFYGKAGTKPKRTMKIVSLDKERLVVKR